jgi:regulatory protein
MKKRIKTKRKSKTLFTVFENENPWGVLPEKILHFFLLIPDQEVEIDEEKFAELISEMEKYAWGRLLNYLSYQERSKFECFNYLENLPLRSEIADKLIQRAISLNHINESRLCKIYIGDLQEKSKSFLEIKNKLRAKGVNREIIEKALDQFYDPNKEESILKELINKVERKYSYLPVRTRKEKILNYLTRKGFSYWKVKDLISNE